MIERFNHQENLEIPYEHDDAYEDNDVYEDDIYKNIAAERIILCGDGDGDRTYEGVSYIWVDPDYQGQLSPGQLKLYELLITLQQGAIYASTTIGKLAEAQGLRNPCACCHRLENLQSVGAIHGLKL